MTSRPNRTLAEQAALPEQPSDEEMNTRAASLDVYADGVAKIATKDNANEGWLKGLELGLRNTAALLRRLAPRQSEGWMPIVREWQEARKAVGSFGRLADAEAALAALVVAAPRP